MALAGSEDISNTLNGGHCVPFWLRHHMVYALPFAQPWPPRSLPCLVAFPPEGLELSFAYPLWLPIKPDGEVLWRLVCIISHYGSLCFVMLTWAQQKLWKRLNHAELNSACKINVELKYFHHLVVSACSAETEKVFKLSSEENLQPFKDNMDMFLSQGETVLIISTQDVSCH